ncbi:MAG: hypothetical protein V8R82_01945 [Clostridia bacterium]
MKILNYYDIKIEPSKLQAQDYIVLSRKKFFWQKSRTLAIITIIPYSAYSIMALEPLAPKKLKHIIDKAREMANIN